MSVSRGLLWGVMVASFSLPSAVLADDAPKKGFASAVADYYRLRDLKKSEPANQWKDALGEAIKATAAGDSKTAEKMFRQALKIAQEHHLPPANSISALDGLSILCEKAHRCAEAETFLKAKLALLPSDRSLYAAQFVPTTLALGLTYRCLNKNDLAIKQFKLVLELEQNSRITRLSRVAAFRLAEAYEAVGDQKRQEATCRWILENQNQPDKQDAVMFWTSRMLGSICLRKREFKEAQQLFQQCLAMPVETKGLTVKDRVSVVRQLGDCYLLQGRLIEAEECYRKGLTRAGSIKDLIELRCGLQLGLADVYTASRRYQEAEPLYKSALAELAVVLGQNDRALAEQMQRYAKLLKVTGRKHEYDELQKKRLQILKRAAFARTKRGSASLH